MCSLPDLVHYRVSFSLCFFALSLRPLRPNGILSNNSVAIKIRISQMPSSFNVYKGIQVLTFPNSMKINEIHKNSHEQFIYFYLSFIIQNGFSANTEWSLNVNVRMREEKKKKCVWVIGQDSPHSLFITFIFFRSLSLLLSWRRIFYPSYIRFRPYHSSSLHFSKKGQSFCSLSFMSSWKVTTTYGHRNHFSKYISNMLLIQWKSVFTCR